MEVSKVLCNGEVACALDVHDAGTMDYGDALRLQSDLLNKRIAGDVPDTLIIVEHDPVVTLGRTAGEGSVFDRAFFEGKRVPVIPTGRGGQNTYHGHGQLVLYPILKLEEGRKDIGLYIDLLEKTITRSLDRLGVPARRAPGRRGVWLGEKKIAFIGIAVRKWVTFHGAAVNINNDITPFEHMHPCGEEGIRVTSVREYKGAEVDFAEVKKVFTDQFRKDLGSGWK